MVRPKPREQDLTGSEASGGLAASNHRIKRLRRLVTQRKARSQERAFVVEGPSLVSEALTAFADGLPVAVEGVYLEPGRWDPVMGQAEALDVPIHRVAPGVLGATLDTVTPQPVAAVVSRPRTDLDALGSAGIVVVMVDPRDPGNVGTLIRSAEAAGAAGVVLAGSAVDPTNPKVVRAAAGAGLRLPVVTRQDTTAALDELARSGRTLAATVIDDEATPYDQVEWEGTAVILGNETHGLDRAVIERAELTVTIQLAGPTESLNLGVAGSLFCFEALRQRRTTDDPG